MSLFVLLATAGTFGLLGGLHCVAMCSALQRVAVHGLDTPRPAHPAAQAPRRRVLPIVPALVAVGSPPSPLGADLRFHAARLAAYAALGAAVGAGSEVLRWGSDVMPLMRPLWGTLNALMLVLGLTLLALGRQPTWIDALGVRAWRATGARLSRLTKGARPVLMGLAWAAVPCGLLYSALATAALASDPMRGAAAMLAFGAGTALNLLGAQAILHRITRGSATRAAQVERLGVRIGGALLAAMAIAALVALASGQPHPFCPT